MAAPSDSVQQAHDYIAEQATARGVAHTCPLCSSAGTERAKEETNVADTDNRYSESQHLALLETAVARETAGLTAAKDEAEATVASLTTEKAELESRLSESETRVGVLEAEKAAAEAQAEAARNEFTQFKAEQERAAAVAAAREARTERVRAANSTLPESHFTEERIGRWAEMSDEAFEAVVAAYEAGAGTAGAPAATTQEQARETAAFTGGSEGGLPSTTGSLVGAFLSRNR
jgi:hypothetical protein